MRNIGRWILLEEAGGFRFIAGMPYLLIQTNAELPEAKQGALLAAVSRLIAEQFGKPPEYVMAGIETKLRMSFAGSSSATAFLSLKSIGLPEAKLKTISALLCKLMAEHAGVPGTRVFIEFTDVAAKHWGHDGDTFG